MWLLVTVTLSFIFEIYSASTSITPANSQQFFDVIAKSNVVESLSSQDSVEVICQLPKRDDYVYLKGVGAYKLHTDAKTWNEARKICKDESAHLAILNSKAEENFLMESLNKSANAITGAASVRAAFLGVHNLFGSVEWMTVSGESLYAAGYENWSVGQPDNWRGSERCAAVNIVGGMDDVNCNVTLAYFCELFLSCRLK